MHYDLFAILLYTERGKYLTIRFAIGHRAELVKNLKIPLGEGITGAAAASQEAILVSDVHRDDRYLNSLDAVRAELAVPMVVRSRLVGVIDVQSTQPGAYNEYDRAIVRLIASRVASAIDNARLYRRAERQNRTLRALGRISQEFAAILELEELLSKIASTMRDLINYDAFSILLVDETRTLLKHKFSIRYDERVKIDNIPIGKGITGAAAQSRESIRVGDTSQDPRYIASHPDARSEVAVPLIVRDTVVGVMDLESNRLNYFTDDHMRTLSLLAPANRHFGRKRSPLRGNRSAGARHAGRSKSGQRVAGRAPSNGIAGNVGNRFRHRSSPGAGDLGRSLRFLRTSPSQKR